MLVWYARSETESGKYANPSSYTSTSEKALFGENIIRQIFCSGDGNSVHSSAYSLAQQCSCVRNLFDSVGLCRDCQSDEQRSLDKEHIDRIRLQLGGYPDNYAIQMSTYGGILQ